MSDDDLDEEEKEMLRKYRAESASKVDRWFEKELVAEARSSHAGGGDGGVTFTGSSLSGAGLEGGGSASSQSARSVRRMLGGLATSFWTKVAGEKTSRSQGVESPGGQRKRQQQQRVVGIETNSIAAPELTSEELLRMWREEIMPSFADRIRMRWVQNLVHRGIPRVVRGPAWLQMIGNPERLDERRYEELLRRCGQIGGTVPGVDEIPLDLPRTHFGGRGVDPAQLLPVLQAVSCLKPEVGYVQGMSYVGAMFLLFMGPVDAFVGMGNMLYRPGSFFPGFLKMDLDSIRLRWRVFQVLLGQECSDLACHFDAVGLSADLYLTDWWFTLFAKDFPVEVASKVWDCFLLEGEPFLFKMALGICLFLRERLMAMSLEECSGLLGGASKAMSEAELFQGARGVSSSTRLIREMLRQAPPVDP